MNLREQILSKPDLPKEEIYIPEWELSVYVRGLTGLERDRFEQSIVEQRGKVQKLNLDNARAKLVSLCTIDSDGNRVFTDNDAAELGNKSASALNKIFEVAQRLSGLTPKDVEELTDNLKNARKDGSTLS